MVLFSLMAFPDLTNSAVWMSFLTLTFLEIVLGVDNIIFISLITSKIPKELQKKATYIGLILAMVLRIVLLFGISILIGMSQPWLVLNAKYISASFSGQSLILIAGGLFLLYKSVTEIHHKLEGDDQVDETHKKNKMTLNAAILQITLINIVFSFDSILTAVGMTNGLYGSFIIMVVAVIVSVLIMIAFAIPIGKFVNEHPTIQILGLAFLILIGFMLVLEGGHLAHLNVFGSEIGAVPKGYLYFAIAFSLMVEFLNLRLRKKHNTIVTLNSASNEAEQQGLLQ
ncbi:MAG: TerC family protein [Saprospiraceae bacterium]